MTQMTLEQAISIANERNPDITLATIAVRAAEASLLSADTTPNPNLSVHTASINPRQGIGAGSLRDKTIDSTLRVEQLIERGGKRELRTRNASALADASRADFHEARRQLRLNVAYAFYDLLAAQDRLNAIQATAGLFAATLEAAQKRRAAGDLAGADVERLRVDALRAQNDVRQSQADLVRSQLTLALMMGIDLPDRRNVPAISARSDWPMPQASLNSSASSATSATSPSTPLPGADLDALIAERPDIRAAQARLAAAEAALRLAQASRTRDVSVGMQYERSPASMQNGYISSNTYGVSVQVPLFVNHYYEGDIRNALAGVDSARESLHRQQRTAQAELLRAQEDMQAAADRLLRLRDQLSVAAGKAAQAAEFAFRNGAIGVTDVLDARRTLRAITLDELNARTDYARALAALASATPSPQQTK